jgi:NAD-dependent DNA ligase
VEASKEVALEKFLFALGIRHFGEEGAILVKKYALDKNFRFSVFVFGLQSIKNPND